MPRLRGGRPGIRLAVHLLFAAAMVLAGPVTAAAEASAPCADFMTSMSRSLADQHGRFARPLVVSRNAPAFGSEIFDLVTNTHVDGTLQCRGDRLVRFEATIRVPADALALKGFAQVQKAALSAALRWPPARAATVLRTLNREAAEYLRASIERGDVYIAGKTEYHENGSDLGMIWTQTDRTFIIAGSE